MGDNCGGKKLSSTHSASELQKKTALLNCQSQKANDMAACTWIRGQAECFKHDMLYQFKTIFMDAKDKLANINDGVLHDIQIRLKRAFLAQYKCIMDVTSGPGRMFADGPMSEYERTVSDRLVYERMVSDGIERISPQKSLIGYKLLQAIDNVLSLQDETGTSFLHEMLLEECHNEQSRRQEQRQKPQDRPVRVSVNKINTGRYEIFLLGSNVDMSCALELISAAIDHLCIQCYPRDGLDAIISYVRGQGNASESYKNYDFNVCKQVCDKVDIRFCISR
jgi:hypothetical protein